MGNSLLLSLKSRHVTARSQEAWSSKQWLSLYICCQTFVYKRRDQDFIPCSQICLYIYISSHEIKEWKYLQFMIIIITQVQSQLPSPGKQGQHILAFQSKHFKLPILTLSFTLTIFSCIYEFSLKQAIVISRTLVYWIIAA